MLTLNLARIRTASERFDEVYAPETCSAEGDSFDVTAPLSLGFDVFKDGHRFRLVGRVETGLKLSCSRCLESFPSPVAAAFDLVYLPRGQNVGEGERELADDDFSTAFYDDETIDLVQLVREQLYLALPMKPLCGDDCQGLCPECGTNLNRGSCGCKRDWDDPRLAALRALTGKP
jgi:uncharacterized protein